MRTLLPDPPPPEFEALLERRRQFGADRHDEVWEGVQHMSPEPSRAHLDVQQQLAELLGPLARRASLVPGIGGFNLGTEEDYRAPDGGLFRERSADVWNATAALVLEIVSPNDETWEKLPFYAAHQVDELLIVDPAKQSVSWLELAGDRYEPIPRSRLIELGAAELAGRIDWPPASA
jgi:Uma2 family endonuclease